MQKNENIVYPANENPISMAIYCIFVVEIGSSCPQLTIETFES